VLAAIISDAAQQLYLDRLATRLQLEGGWTQSLKIASMTVLWPPKVVPICL